MSMGSTIFFGSSTRTGAPNSIWSALAPMMRAFSKRVCFL
jgi:hypothetical protein